MHKFKLALLQTRCVPDKLLNIQYICEALATAAANGSKMSILGEICNSPYNRQHMLDNAEDFGDSMTLKAIQKSCCEHGMYAIGTIPRIHQGKYFNTAFVINAKGDLQAQMDKIHLFDIDIPGKITYK